MKVHFERSGGVAGMLLTLTIETETLPEADARELESLIGAAKFFDLPRVITGTGRGADQFQYKITVETHERSHSVETGDSAAPEALRPLLQRLTTLARSSRGK
jgi:hypothetical protein